MRILIKLYEHAALCIIKDDDDDDVLGLKICLEKSEIFFHL